MWLEKAEISYFTASTLYIIVIFAVTYMLQVLYKRQQKINAINLLPGPKTLPIIGNVMNYYGPFSEHYKRLGAKVCIYPCGLSRTWIGSKPRCTIYKASKVEPILSSQKYIEKGNAYEAIQPWLGLGLLTLTGSKWQERRKMLTPTFHFKIMEDFIEVFNQQSKKFVSILQEKADEKPFDIFTSITLCTLDIILESAMGRSINAQGNSESDYVKAVNRLGTIVITRQLRPWLKPNLIFRLSGYAQEFDECLNILHGFSNATIKERRMKYRLLKSHDHENGKLNGFLGKSGKMAFLDLLLETEEKDHPLSDEDIRAEVDTFMFEGHDTTAAAIGWSIYLLGSHPQIQEKVYVELGNIFGNSDRPATSDDLREMKYLECCIKESLRIFPSVPAIARQLNEDVEIDGYKLPSGISVYINKYILHRDPEYFPDPEEYKPERFFPENAAKRHPYAFIPFSAGPRNCIGQKFAMMEEKVVLSSIFRNFRVESMDKREDLMMNVNLILRPANGILVKLYPRK